LVEKESRKQVKALRSDNGGEYISNEFKYFCNKEGIWRELIAPHNPQKNGVVERKKRTIQEMDRTILNEAKLRDTFWRELVSTTIYIFNRAQIRVNNNKTPYELWKGRPTTVKYFKVFGRKFYIKRNEDTLGKFESRTYEGIFLGYASGSSAYKWYTKRLCKLVDSSDVRVDESIPQKEKSQKN